MSQRTVQGFSSVGMHRILIWPAGYPANQKKAGYHRYPAGYLVRPDTGYPARILDLIFKCQVLFIDGGVSALRILHTVGSVLVLIQKKVGLIEIRLYRKGIYILADIHGMDHFCTKLAPPPYNKPRSCVSTWGQHRRSRYPWLGRLLIILAPILLIV
jgi:hypothetical protein